VIDLIFRMVAGVVETHGRASRVALRLPAVAPLLRRRTAVRLYGDALPVVPMAQRRRASEP
jgi:hypothetical protein